MLTITESNVATMVAHCIHVLPEEGCGLLIGDAGTGVVTDVVKTENVAHSAKLYTVDPKAHLRADRDAGARGLDVIGVFHSHTHTEAYPSPTDIGQAPDPTWHYVVISLRDVDPVIRSYAITSGDVVEEHVEVV